MDQGLTSLICCCLVNGLAVYLMTVDNSGPQSVSEVMEGWRNLRLLFPNATILDSSLEAFTAEAWKVKDRMPAVTAELGDTWIRGTASDPTKQRRYREVARRLAAATLDGSLKITQPEVQRAYDQLIKLPEHTYGSNDGRVAGAYIQICCSSCVPTRLEVPILKMLGGRDAMGQQVHGPAHQRHKLPYHEQRLV